MSEDGSREEVKVYVVSSGCQYEGGGVDCVFASEGRANEYIAPIEAARFRNERTFDIGHALRNYAYGIVGHDCRLIIRSSEIEERFNRGAHDVTCLGGSDYIRVHGWEVIE